MRLALPLAFATLLACARAPAPAPSVSLPSAPPALGRRDDDAQAAYDLDAAEASVEEAQKASHALALVAGGEAADALNEIAKALDAAGRDLADVEPPPAGRGYTDAERKAAGQAATDALGELRGAGDILDDLAQNAPPEHTKTLEAVRAFAGEAEDALAEALDRLE